MIIVEKSVIASSVALRKESVDRNRGDIVSGQNGRWSLSARRAWIEIFDVYIIRQRVFVALRKESVDRNIFIRSFVLFLLCRSPQGERG